MNGGQPKRHLLFLAFTDLTPISWSLDVSCFSEDDTSSQMNADTPEGY